jgi:plasmid stabilization system protein ParE
MSIEIVDRAQIDMELIAEDIRDDSGVAAAERFADRLNRTLALLERLSRLGEIIDPPFPRYPDLRMMQVHRQPHHVIYFCPTRTGIRVVRVLHTSRDAGAIFG